jgi:hypothetical protein
VYCPWQANGLLGFLGAETLPDLSLMNGSSVHWYNNGAMLNEIKQDHLLIN